MSGAIGSGEDDGQANPCMRASSGNPVRRLSFFHGSGEPMHEVDAFGVRCRLGDQRWPALAFAAVSVRAIAQPPA